MVFAIIIVLLLPMIYGLSVLVAKEDMENVKSVPEAEKGNEKFQPAFHLFLYLASFFSLGFLVSGVLTVYFQLINKFVEEKDLSDRFSNVSTFDDSAVKFGLSALLISSIVYFSFLYLINRKLDKGEIRKDSSVRKFLTYVALFILVAMTIGSLAVLFFNYLNGELTGNVFWKIVLFFLVALFFVLFYFWEIRRKSFAGKTFNILFGSAIAIAISGILAGILIADSPKTTREKRIDGQIISEMQNMKFDIENLYNNSKKLPGVSDVQKSARFDIKYLIKNDKEYQICGYFFQNKEDRDFQQKAWNHPAGNHCFTFDIDARELKEPMP